MHLGYHDDGSVERDDNLCGHINNRILEFSSKFLREVDGDELVGKDVVLVYG